MTNFEIIARIVFIVCSAYGAFSAARGMKHADAMSMRITAVAYFIVAALCAWVAVHHANVLFEHFLNLK